MTSKPVSSLEEDKVIRLPKSREIAAIGLFGALSIILTIISNLVLKLAFIPPVSYLLFDLGEIPVIICFLIIGPRAGFSVAIIEWLSLNLLPTSSPVIGPLFKLMSVISTVVGMWIAWSLLSRTTKSDLRMKFAVSSGSAALVRAAIMTIPNALLLNLGFGLTPTNSIFFYILELTAIFNVLQIPFDMIPTYIVIQLPQVKHMLRKNGLTWFESKRIR